MTRLPYLSINISRVHSDAIIPSYAHHDDAGADLYAIEDALVPAHGQCLVSTGLAIELPHGFVGLVHSRSGLATKHGVAVVNSPGTIDAGYRGEIRIGLINHSDEDFHVERGMRIAQLLIQRVEHAMFTVVDSLADSDRGNAGFGSTGVN